MAAQKAVGSVALCQQYYEEIQLDPLLTKILKHLGKTRPQKPITAMIEILREEGIKRKEFTIESAPVFPNLNESAEGESEREDNESLPGSMGSPVAAPPPVYPRRRRENVFAEQVVEEENFVPPVYEKSEEEASFIRDALRRCALFGTPEPGMTAEEDLLVNACFKRELKQGEVVIQQGSEGHEWFILAEGEADCFVRVPGFSADNMREGIDDAILGRNVLHYVPSMSFGELALMYNAPRAATIRVVSPSAAVWVLDRTTFKQTLMRAQKNLRSEQLSAVQSFPMFEYLTRYEQLRIADALEVRSFAAGERIIAEGSEGSQFYLLVDGSCRCVKFDAASGEERECFRHLVKGDYFGEISLLKKAPCAASVDALVDSKCFALPKDAFLRLIGPLDDVLRRNMESYARWEREYGLKSSQLQQQQQNATTSAIAIPAEEQERVEAIPTSSADSPTRVPRKEEHEEGDDRPEGVTSLPDDE